MRGIRSFVASSPVADVFAVDADVAFGGVASALGAGFVHVGVVHVGGGESVAGREGSASRVGVPARHGRMPIIFRKHRRWYAVSIVSVSVT